MLYREIIAVCSQIHIKSTDKLCSGERKTFAWTDWCCGGAVHKEAAGYRPIADLSH